MSIWAKQGNFAVLKSTELSSCQLQNQAESLTVSGLVFINNSAWMYIGQSTVQPSATQLDFLCYTLTDWKADRCSFCERKKEQNREMGRREETSVWGHKISTVFPSLRFLFYFHQQCEISAPPRCSLSSRASASMCARLVCWLFLSSLVRNNSPYWRVAHSGGDRDLIATTPFCWLPHFTYNECLSSGHVCVAR